MKIKISTDSTADIPIHLQKELNITVLPLSIVTEDGVEYKDGVDIEPKKFYEIAESCAKLPTSSAIAPQTYIEYYEKVLAEGFTDIIHVSLNSKGSGTYQNALIARDMFLAENSAAEGRLNIHIIDSQNYSEGYGMAVIEAARMAQSGKGVGEITEYITYWLSNVRTVFLPFNLKCVKKSGRLSAAAAFVGDALGLKPIISFENGESVVLSKARGERNAIRELIKTVKSERLPGSRYALAMGNNFENFKSFKSELTEQLGEAPEFDYYLGCIIAINAGPNAVGIIYLRDNT